jgi:hypothetical protein
MHIMMFRAFVCCAALIIGLLAVVGVTAQSAAVCSGTTCGSSAKAAPLNLMNFINGSAKAGATQSVAAAPGKASRGRHRHKVKTAARSRSEGRFASSEPPAASPEPPAVSPEPAAPSPEPPALPTAATAAYAAHSPDDVQVVSGDEVNAIDLATSNTDNSTAKTSGVAPGAEPYKPSDAPAPANGSAGNATMGDDSWMGRFWATIGNGFIALVGMVRQLFG